MDGPTSTRRFSIPAGTVIDGFTVPETLTRVIEYSKSEMTASQAQKAALRDVRAQLADRFGVTATQKAIQAATATVQRQTGRARGGRVPDRLKVQGFRRVSGVPGTRQVIPGLVTYTRGHVKGRPLAGIRGMLEQLLSTLFDAGQRNVAVKLYGKPPEDQSGPHDKSVRRYKRDSPIGTWKKGDPMPHAKHWASTIALDDMVTWERLYGDDESVGDLLNLNMDWIARADVAVRSNG